MKTMTIEELREIAEEKGFPIELESMNKTCVDISVHAVVGDLLAYTSAKESLTVMHAYVISDYKSHKSEPRIETIYECLTGNSTSHWIFEDGRYPIFHLKKKSDANFSEDLSRKTGRTLKINMDTFEIVTEE